MCSRVRSGSPMSPTRTSRVSTWVRINSGRSERQATSAPTCLTIEPPRRCDPCSGSSSPEIVAFDAPLDEFLDQPVLFCQLDVVLLQVSAPRAHDDRLHEIAR